MIFQANNKYYLKKDDKYYLADIVVKPNTIVIDSTEQFVTDLEGAVEVDYKIVKARYIKEESTEVGSLNSNKGVKKSIWAK